VLRDAIIPLARARWEGYVLPFHYISHSYYEVEIVREADDFRVSFVKKPLAEPFELKPDGSDKLFQPHWEEVMAWGVTEGGRLVTAIETAVEKWSNRLRVTWLWIDDAFRRQGLGTALMDIAVQRARDEMVCYPQIGQRKRKC